uniref:Ring finger protein 17 n=1 Tax=Leptobrachium leishanense TaxID=445787 RepID=A0A8C5LZQ3_9ANUR
MADREQKCEGCQRSVCGDLDKLVCGHCLCRECSCNLDSLNRLCPVCMTCVSDNVEILSDKDIVLSDKELAMEISDKDEMDIAQVECVETNDHEVECEKEIMEDVKGSDISGLVDPKITLCQRITGALVTANESFRQLDTALETLKHLEDKIKQNEDNATKAVKQEFLKFAYLLNTRKLHLIGEIHRQTDVYAAAIAKAVDNIMEKKAGLEARVTIAKTVLKSPSESVYCNLDQLVKLLKVNVESDCLVSDSLMKGFNVRVLFDDEADSQNFEKIGKLCSDQLEIGQGDSSYVDLTVDGNSSTCSLVSNYMRGSDGRQVEVECEMEGGKRSYFEEKSCSLKKLDSPTSHNAVAVFPQSLRDPDVIIEEIIDDSDSAYSDVNDSFQTNRTKDISQRTPHLNKAIGRIQNRPKTLKNPRVKSPTMKDFQENVQLVHVINPCHFYVHRIAHKKSLLMLERTLKALGQSPNSCSQSDTLVIGEMVVFYSAECNLWCRGRIVELIPLESKYKGTIYPVSYKMEDIYQMKVFLLDYGSCEVFSISRMTRSHLAKNETVFRSIVDLCLILRKLDQNSYLGRTPPFAVQCSLMGIVPQNSEEQWSKEATEEMLKMFKKKSVTMKVFRKEDDKLIVDLRKPSINTANSDTPASLRDALLFLDLARIGSQVPNAETRIKMLQYPKPVLPEEAAQVEVLVCNTNDPSDFYIHVLACSQYLNIVRKIQEIYSREESGEFEVLSPVMGQPCIAQYEDEDWYRGEVVGRPNQHEVEIRFVDFGNITRVNVGKLRSITEELLRIPCQAVCCRLANIQPIDSAPQWSVHACEEFGKVATDKRLKCIVIGVLMDKKLSIELYEDDPRNLNSINTILVKKDLASFICCDGMILNQHPTSEVWDPPSDVLSETFEDGVDMMALLEHKALFVVVSHVVSPSSIFVQWKSAENFIKSFQETLNDRYENTPPENKEWCVAMYVAVKHSSSKQWRRGMIENLVEKGVEVFLYDFGNKEVIDVSHIRTLDESHKLYGAFCLECSLIDIKPSGGCTEWTKTACEVLSFYLKGAEVTVVIEESTSKWPLPVKMTCNDEAGQLVDISSFLVRQGLALKERRYIYLLCFLLGWVHTSVHYDALYDVRCSI